MSDTTPKFKAPRHLPEITGEYQRLAMTAGDLQYKIDVFKRDLSMINEQLRELNFEAVAAQQRDAEEAKKKAEEEASKTKAEEPKAVENNVVSIDEKKEG